MNKFVELNILDNIIMSEDYPIPMILYNMIKDLKLYRSSIKILLLIVGHIIETDEVIMKYKKSYLDRVIGMDFYKGFKELKSKNMVYIFGSVKDGKYIVLQPFVELWDNGRYIDIYNYHINLIMDKIY